MKAIKRIASFVIVLSAMTAQSVAQRPDDVVVMKNGDHFTGEIKGLQRGELSFKAGYMAESVRLDWSKVERLESENFFLVSLADGRRYAGRIQQTGGRINDELEIDAGGGRVRASPSEVIVIQQRRASFWQQLDGSVNYGFTFTGDNNQATSALSANVAYNGRKNRVQLSSSSQLNVQSKGINTSRFTFNGEYMRKVTQN